MTRRQREALLIALLFACMWGLHLVNERDREHPVRKPVPVSIFDASHELDPINVTAADVAQEGK